MTSKRGGREYMREYTRKYRVTHLEQVRAINRKAVKKYNAAHLERVRTTRLKAYKKFASTHPEQIRELWRKAFKKYYATHKGAARERKKRYIRAHPEIRRASRKRWKASREEKGFIPLAPNNWNCIVDWHHVSPNHPYVVPLPRSVHQAVYGKYHFIFNAAMTCRLFELDLRERADHPFLPTWASTEP